MIGIVCLIVEGCASGVLVFEYFCKDSFSIAWLTVNGLTISLDAHSSTMDCVELVFDVIWGPWWSLPTSGSCWMWSVITLSNRWSRDFKLSSWPWYQILCLIAARLEHKTLILFRVGWHVVLDGRGVNWLPSVLWTRWHLSILYHTVNDMLVIPALPFPLGVFLIDKSHWKLANIDWVIWILHDDSILLLLFLLICVLRLLNRSKSTTRHLVVVSTSSLVNGIGCSRWDAHWLASSLDVSLTYILGLNRLMNCLEHCSTIVTRSTVVGSSWWEKSLLTSGVLVLGSVEVLLGGWVLCSSSTCGNTSYMSSVGGVTILSFHRLDNRIVEIHY